jgi:hypothetical protein
MHTFAGTTAQLTFQVNVSATLSHMFLVSSQVPGDDGSQPPVLSPTPQFLGDRFLGSAVWSRLRPDGMLMINALGSEEHLRAIEEVCSKCVHACCC